MREWSTMWRTMISSFLIGIVGGNALPHFMRGITRENYPNALGYQPVPNFLAGWAGLILAGLLGISVDMRRYPKRAFAGLMAGVLLIGLFHAGPGAFGKKPGS